MIADTLVQPLREPREEGLLGLGVPVGLLGGAPGGAVGLVDPPRPVGAEIPRWRLMLDDGVESLEIDQLGIAVILEEQRLGPVTDEHPTLPGNLDALHCHLLAICNQPAARLVLDPPERIAVGDAMPHRRIPCRPRIRTVLACGPFSPLSSTKVTRVPSFSLAKPSSSTLCAWK